MWVKQGINRWFGHVARKNEEVFVMGQSKGDLYKHKALLPRYYWMKQTPNSRIRTPIRQFSIQLLLTLILFQSLLFFFFFISEGSE